MKAGRRALLSALALVAVAGAAVAAAWFGIGRQDEARAARRSSEARLFAFEPADVTGLVVEAKGDLTRIARDGARWRIEAPVRAEGERAAIETLVDRIATLRRKAAVAGVSDGDASGQYGLARPRATVTLALRDGKSASLAVGDENPFDGTLFVRSAGGVSIVPGDLRRAIERSTFDLREKRLIPFDDADLLRVEVTAPKLSYALVRDGADGWRLDAPIRDRADAGAASRVLAAVRALRATAFRPATSAEPPDGPGRRWRVSLTLRGRAPVRVAVWEVTSAARPGPPSGGEPGSSAPLLARVEGSAETATVPDTAARDLDQDLLALRDRILLRFDRDAVASLSIERDGSRFEVRRDAAPGRLAGYVWTLSALQAKGFAAGADRAGAYGLDRPALTLTLHATDGKELAKLRVSAPRGGRTFAIGSSLPGVVELDPGALESLPRTAQEALEPAAPSGTRAAPALPAAAVPAPK